MRIDSGQRDYRLIVVLGALALAVFGGWVGLAYSVVSSRSEITALRAERDAAVAEHERLATSVGELRQVETKLVSARAEYARVAQAWADAKSKVATTQQDLAAVTKRLEQAGERVSQTGSVRAESPKTPARKPAN
jgi:zinc resistance-associated protein